MYKFLFMNVAWHNKLYEMANTQMASSIEHWQKGEIKESWKLSFSSRYIYLVDSIINLALIPLAFVSFIFGMIHCIGTLSTPVVKKTYEVMCTKANHFLISGFGAVVSPWLAYKFRLSNPAPYLAAIRGIIASIILIHTLYP